jgi:hypothetical protein
MSSKRPAQDTQLRIFGKSDNPVRLIDRSAYMRRKALHYLAQGDCTEGALRMLEVLEKRQPREAS